MKPGTLTLVAALLLAGGQAYGQTSPNQNPQAAPAQAQPQHPAKHRGKSAVGEYGSGTGDVSKGAAGGAGNGAAAVGDAVTLHPLKSGEHVGKGAKDVRVGAGKGAGKVVKGTAKIVTHPF